MKKRKFLLLPYGVCRPLVIASLFMVIYGSIMIVSAEMGSSAGSTALIQKTAFKQGVLAIVSVFIFYFLHYLNVSSILRKIGLGSVYFVYTMVLGALLCCLLFSAANGAQAWIRLGPFSLQPSEFAKVVVILLCSQLFSPDSGLEPKKAFNIYLIMVGIYIFVIFLLQKDLGSAVVLGGIAYGMVMLIPYKSLDIHRIWLVRVLFIIIVSVLVLLSPIGMNLFRKMGGYQAARFLVANNPFEYQFDDGYHLIMSMVTFGSGGLFGLGYGKSIHKFMNFPNPSTDFILPVIVEEIGILFGLVVVLLLYGIIIWTLIKYAFRIQNIRSKMILTGTYMYFVLHIVFNIGGVSGLIPLTGVPLLLLSSGGSSLMAAMAALALSDVEIMAYVEKQERL